MSGAEYLSAAEAAERLGISLRTVRRRIADGSLPSVRIGRAVRIPAAALDMPVARPTGTAAREAVASYATDASDDEAAYVARWNAGHWPDTWERMLARRRRALDELAAGLLSPIEPGHLLLDVAAGLERAVRVGRLTGADGRRALGILEAFFVDRTEPFAAAATSLDLALELGIRVADAAYLECARRASTTVVTADRRLARACGRAGVPVVALADLPPR